MIPEGQTSQLTVVRAAGDFGTVIVEYDIPGAEADFSPSSGTLQFLPGDRSMDIVLTAIDDATPENEESFSLRLSITNKTNIPVIDGAKQLLISSNDAPVRFTQVCICKINKPNQLFARYTFCVAIII